MKQLTFILIVFFISGCTSKLSTSTIDNKSKQSFQQVWNQITSDTVDKLPQNKVSIFNLKDLDNNSNRTLNNHSDILEPFNKLAHPNGICFKGIWNIDTPNQYSGYFKNNSKALIIARASTALSNTTSDDTRAFGFAGKLFPTLNQNEISKENSANFFLIDDFGGTNAKFYSDVELTNEPKLSFTLEVLNNLLYAIRVAYSFGRADDNSGIRQLYEISYLGEGKLKNIITPKWMKIKATHNIKSMQKDFRDELQIKMNDKLTFDIFVANKIIDETKNWKRIGNIELDTSVVSNSCDHRLHFHHPKWINNLNYGK